MTLRHVPTAAERDQAFRKKQRLDRSKKEVVERRESVHHPRHYGGDTVYEVIKVIDAWELNFNLGNSVKYIARAGRKDNKLEDLKKAAWYLQHEIDTLEKVTTK